jgi:hypothetical protein
MPYLKKPLLLLACLAMSGCATTVHSYDVRAVGDEHTQWNSFFLWGAVGKTDVDVQEICGQGQKAAEVGVKATFFTVAASIVTLGVYSPFDSFVRCGEATQATAVLR